MMAQAVLHVTNIRTMETGSGSLLWDTDVIDQDYAVRVGVTNIADDFGWPVNDDDCLIDYIEIVVRMQ